jgi:diguanylate cyclase (GGDEF)-like protein
MEPESNTVKVLLIEDDEDDYLLIREYLSESDSTTKFVTDWVQTYQEGLKKIERGEHDVYLIDHFLGADSGLDLLKEAVMAGCQAPLIIVTGQSQREIDHAALKAGAMDYLEKANLNAQVLERSIRYALEQNRLLKKIHEMAVRDALTGLFNRRELHRFLDYEIIKSKRYHHSFSILLMDVDNFKEINDQFGHHTGDEVLVKVASVVSKSMRACDLPCRYGGDEFIVVLPETPASQAIHGAERLRKTVESMEVIARTEDGRSEKITVTLSIGISGYPEDSEFNDRLIELADKALYQAKHQGCNQVVGYTSQV